MSPIGRILVAFDGSDKDAAALEWALAIAHPLGACVEVVHALGLRESSHRPTDDGSESAGLAALESSSMKTWRYVKLGPSSAWKYTRAPSFSTYMPPSGAAGSVDV